jgi:hypothetical protein
MPNSSTAILLTATLTSLLAAGVPSAHADDPQPDTSSVTQRRTVIESITTTNDQGTTAPAAAPAWAPGSSAAAPAAAPAPAPGDVVEWRGYLGIRNANTFAPNYKKRFNTYDEQLQMGLTKGWLSSDEVARFKLELTRLRELELAVEKKGYPKEELGSLDKQVTQFNIDLTKAANKPQTAPPTAPAATPASTPSPQPPAPGTPATHPQ